MTSTKSSPKPATTAEPPKLTKRQRDVLATVTVFNGEHGRAPSVDELSERLALTPDGVRTALLALADAGLIRRKAGASS